MCRDVAYADLLAGVEEEHALPGAVGLPAGAVVVEHANVKIYDGVTDYFFQYDMIACPKK